jgi:hypothetical protein
MASKRMKLSHESLPTVTSDCVIKPDQFPPDAMEPNPLPLPAYSYNDENKAMVDIMSKPSISKPAQRYFRNESMGITNLFTSEEEESMFYFLDPFDEINLLEKDDGSLA